MYVGQDSDDEPLYSSDSELDSIDSLVTTVRLDEIMHEISTTESTWRELRKQYSPKQSAFEPLSFTASTWATFAKVGITELDNDLVVDEAYSQTATMVAYSVELLRIALSGPQVNRKRVKQVSNILTTLCGSLSDTRDRHRVAISKTLVDKANAYKYSQSVDKDMGTESATSIECVRCTRTSKTRWWGKRVDGSVTRELSRPHRHERRQSDDLEQQQQQFHDRDTVQGVRSTTGAPLSSLSPSIDDIREAGESVEDTPASAVHPMLLDCARILDDIADDTDSSSATDSTVLVSGIVQTSIQELPLELSRQGVIRDGLLRQGFTEAAIAAYFEQFSRIKH
ncbi:hypothetical protein GGI08_002314 [Coemansia sp. S2]|nr:hypothetical protein GGI08_002314 [Coemansia sp. S2]